VKLTGTIIWYEADYTFTYSNGLVAVVPSHGLQAWNVTGNIITMYGENNMSFGGLPLFPAHLKAGTYELCSWYNHEISPGYTVRIWINVTLNIFTRKGHGEPIDYVDADYTATPLGCMIHYEWYQNSGVATYVRYWLPTTTAYSEFTLTGMIMPP
jgi:hypothetical protein